MAELQAVQHCHGSLRNLRLAQTTQEKAGHEHATGATLLLHGKN